jgi:lambda family phage tail tape measure protein
MANQRLNIDVVARDKTKQALGGVQKSLARLKNSVFSLQSAFVGIGAGLVIRNLVNTGKNLENLRTRLKFLLKDTNEGAKAFENMTKFASKVPFSLEQIQQGAGILATVTDNANDLQNMLEITGNVAATTGLDFGTAAEQIQRSFSAGIGAADLFREKGVRNMLGFQAGATVSIEETREAFARVFGKGGQFGKATDELAETFEGTLSMIGDKIFNFKRVLLEAGFFEELKKQFGDLDDFLENNARDLDRIATSVGKNLANGMVRVVQIGKDLIPTINKIGSGLKSILDGFMAMPEFAREIGIVGAFLLGKKGAAGLAGISFVIDKVKDLVQTERIKSGLIDVQSIEQAQLRLIEINKELDEGLRKEYEFIDVRGKGQVILENYNHLTQQQLENLTKEKQKLEEFILLQKIKTTKAFEYTKEVQKGLKTHEEIQEALKKEKESAESVFDVYKKIHDGLDELPKSLEGIGGALEGFGEGLRSEFDVSTFERFKKAGQDSLSALKNSISDFVMTGKLSFQSLSEAIIRSIVDAMVGSAVTAAIKKATEIFKFAAIREGLISAYKAGVKALASVPFPFNIAAAGAVVGTGLKLVDKIKGFEKGGAVSKGQPVMVGERGAELFIPNQTGQITQSARGTGNGATTVNFNINTVDASGFEELLVRSRGTITQLINSAVNERGRENLI